VHKQQSCIVESEGINNPTRGANSKSA